MKESNITLGAFVSNGIIISSLFLEDHLDGLDWIGLLMRSERKTRIGLSGLESLPPVEVLRDLVVRSFLREVRRGGGGGGGRAERNVH